jgi:hypothetical protein
MLSKPMMIATGILVVICLLLWRQNSKLNEEVGKAKAAVEQAAQTNSNNLTTIDDLEERLTACVTERQVDEAASEALVSSLNAEILDLQEEGFGVRIETEEIFREPSCEELGNLDIAAVCPALATSMRDSANSINGSGNPGGAGPGSDTTP